MDWKTDENKQLKQLITTEEDDESVNREIEGQMYVMIKTMKKLGKSSKTGGRTVVLDFLSVFGSLSSVFVQLYCPCRIGRLHAQVCSMLARHGEANDRVFCILGDLSVRLRGSALFLVINSATVYRML